MSFVFCFVEYVFIFFFFFQAEDGIRDHCVTGVQTCALPIWRDGPNASYPDHTHLVRTAHVILDGEMILTSEGRTRTVKAGERLDVPANTIHSARMGPAGCLYLVGEEENSAR